MKVAITGSPMYGYRSLVERVIDALPTSTELIVTGMSGPSTWAVETAAIYNMPRPVVMHIPKCPRGQYPGDKWPMDIYIAHCEKRNKEIITQADCLIAFWDGRDGNTRQLLAKVTEAGKTCLLIPDNNLNCDFNWYVNVIPPMLACIEAKKSFAKV